MRSQRKFYFLKGIGITSLVFIVFAILAIWQHPYKVKTLIKKNHRIHEFFYRISNTTGIGKVKSSGNKYARGRKLSNVVLTINTNKIWRPLKQFWGGFGNDFFYQSVATPEGRAVFNLIKEANANRRVFTYFRAHNIFTDFVAPGNRKIGGWLYSENKSCNVSYNWRRINEVFDTIISSGMKPVVELGFMPSQLSSDPARIGDWRKANVAPPASFEKWYELVHRTAEHLQGRYGDDEVEKWYFEIWNEPDLFRHFWVSQPNRQNKSDIASYLKLYDYSVLAIKNVNPNYKVGGPAIAGLRSFWESFIKHSIDGENYKTKTKGTFLDFLSFHKYGEIRTKILPKVETLLNVALQIDRRKFLNVPFILSETGPSIGNKEAWKNTPYVAAWFCQLVDGFIELSSNKSDIFCPEMIIYWTQFGKKFSGGRSPLVTMFGEKSNISVFKGPLFHAYEVLSYLDGDLIKVDGTKFGDNVHAIATQKRNGDVGLLIYNIDKVSSRATKPATVSIKLSGMAPGNYRIKHFTIDAGHSNTYSQWKRMGSPTHLSNDQIKYLDANDELTLRMPEKKVFIDKIFRNRFEMLANSVDLILLDKE